MLCQPEQPVCPPRWAEEEEVDLANALLMVNDNLSERTTILTNLSHEDDIPVHTNLDGLLVWLCAPKQILKKLKRAAKHVSN